MKFILNNSIKYEVELFVLNLNSKCETEFYDLKLGIKDVIPVIYGLNYFKSIDLGMRIEFKGFNSCKYNWIFLKRKLFVFK